MIACVGAGHWSRNAVRNSHGLGVLSCVCDPKSQAGARITADHPGVSTTDSLDEILKDSQIQGVAIAEAASTHGSIRARALGER